MTVRKWAMVNTTAAVLASALSAAVPGEENGGGRKAASQSVRMTLHRELDEVLTTPIREVKEAANKVEGKFIDLLTGVIPELLK